jgi:hypothetical protein
MKTSAVALSLIGGLLLARLAAVVAEPKASENAPRVRGFFIYSEDFCKKRCNASEACFVECTHHPLTSEELREVMKQQKLAK